MTEQIPNPGSEAALAQGCLCPVLDNEYGRGTFGTVDKPQAEKNFWINGDCPLHGNPGQERVRIRV